MPTDVLELIGIFVMFITSYMQTIVNRNNVEIRLCNILASNNRVYAIFHIHNNTSGQASVYINHLTDSDIPFLYYSKTRGVFDYCGTYPIESSTVYYIPANCFQEIQVIYGAYEIGVGDEFDVNFVIYTYGFTKSIKCRIHFQAIENGWEISATPINKGKKDEFYISNKDMKIVVHYITEEDEKKKSISNPYETLNSLIGLQTVKDEVLSLSNFVKIQKLRENKGMKSAAISYHCVFTGNPGTGKTTVARIVASIYKELGILKKGHLIETDRSGLVGKYIGHTAAKTNEIIDSALDGVLFIDEAYALAQQESPNDFGNEAISTLLKRMEDDRDRLIVIIAGYSKEMKDFINANSGLKSRFVRYINFPDYSAEELFTIFEKCIDNGGYLIAEDAIPFAKNLFATVIDLGDRNFGNGRYVRNLYEESIKSQANRIASKQDITDADLVIIEREDIESASRNIKVEID